MSAVATTATTKFSKKEHKRDRDLGQILLWIICRTRYRFKMWGIIGKMGITVFIIIVWSNRNEIEKNKGKKSSF